MSNIKTGAIVSAEGKVIATLDYTKMDLSVKGVGHTIFYKEDSVVAIVPEDLLFIRVFPKAEPIQAELKSDTPEVSKMLE